MSEDILQVIKDTINNIEWIQSYKNHPGKFEGESLATNYYYDLSLNGGESVFEVTPAEKSLFQIESAFVRIREDDNGFVYLDESNDESDFEDEEDESDFEEW